MTADPRELLRKLNALEPYPAAIVVEVAHRLDLDPNASLDDLGAPDDFAIREGRKLAATIAAMHAASGGRC